jgi:predicted nucleic acid-binding Zn ribbon protein
MPTYDYHCDSNNQTVEVNHSIRERLTTWGSVCESAGLPLGETPADAPVTRLIAGAGLVHSSALRNPEQPPCQTGAPCCGANRCGFA